MANKLRPPAVPLATIDPYFSIWSNANQLHAAETIHWTGATHGMVGLAVIDGKVWRFMGGYDRRSDFKSLNAPAMQQTDLTIKPLSSIYTFEAGGITLTVNFTTPLLLDDLDVMARPTSYITVKACSNDGENHHVNIYYDITSELAVDVPIQEVVTSRNRLEDGSQLLQVGTEKQEVLKRKGDMIRVDWGYATLVIPDGTAATTAIGSVDIRDQFIEWKTLPETDDQHFPRAVDHDMPILASVLDYGEVGVKEVSNYLIVAYDDVYAIEYFNKHLPGYWARNGQSFEDVVLASIREYSVITEKCNRFNNEMIANAKEAGGEKYADILALSYRQAIAAHKLVADENGEILFLSKENNSNGCLATVDVSYPSMPLFLLYNTELVRGMLRPIFQYADSKAWPYEFAPHDIGRYPVAEGQAYGMELKRQMPIEECGNMLIMTAAVCWAEQSTSFASDYWGLLQQWANYLIEYGMDPGNQLCTDDFGGHLAHNANLSIKAIIGIASYGFLSGWMGNEEGVEYLQKAKEMASQWESMARDDDHYRLTFDTPGTWSLKYNLVWDNLFQLNLFSEDLKKKEVAWYLRKSNPYGTPLDNRKTYTKADWLIWAATLAEEKTDFQQLINPIWDFLNETDSRVPFTDWYYTIDGRIAGFKNRSVVGGLFIKLLADRMDEPK
ncbi:glutaminase family protein [Gracilibacillus phocaeensis]|uniref:glutaminase family protein n=1 Tax=Gracilibacillus phocaeensis TaxID=2042304 RepID=UPI00103049EA|nr:glutaminase family protein [Gracilibacillus phocaeensis]